MGVRLGEGEPVPFEDEISPHGVTVVAYRPEWAQEAAQLADELRGNVHTSLAIEHIGSTAVPGMAAKDCLDLMIVVDDLATAGVEQRLAPQGYRRRPEPWNNLESAGGGAWPKQVFAPPVGARLCNLHVRTAGSETSRLALLFRDHLRAHSQRTAWWSQLKTVAAAAAPDLATYGRMKHPAWCLLMEHAEALGRRNRLGSARLPPSRSLPVGVAKRHVRETGAGPAVVRRPVRLRAASGRQPGGYALPWSLPASCAVPGSGTRSLRDRLRQPPAPWLV